MTSCAKWILAGLIVVYLPTCSNERPTTNYHCFIYQEGDSSVVDLRYVINTDLTVRDGKVLEFNPAHVFFGYDTSIVRFTTFRAIPLRVGQTIIFVRHPNNDSSRVVDTVAIEVTRSGSWLRVNQRPPT